MENELTVMAIAVVAIAFVLILLWAFLVKLEEFRAELDYLNMEIRRAEGAEKKYWKKKRRQLWLSLLPFFSE